MGNMLMLYAHTPSTMFYMKSNNFRVCFHLKSSSNNKKKKKLILLFHFMDFQNLLILSYLSDPLSSHFWRVFVSLHRQILNSSTYLFVFSFFCCHCCSLIFLGALFSAFRMPKQRVHYLCTQLTGITV